MSARMRPPFRDRPGPAVTFAAPRPPTPRPGSPPSCRWLPSPGPVRAPRSPLPSMPPPSSRPPAAAVRWRVRLLGGVRADDGEQSIERFGSGRVAALLARLAMYPSRRHSREELVELLWPGVDIDAGRNRLRQSLFALRALLEPPSPLPRPVIVADRGSIGAVEGALECDAVEFERAVREGRHADALALYRGELLPGHYEEWIDEERLRLAALAERAEAALSRAGAAPTPPPGPDASSPPAVARRERSPAAGLPDALLRPGSGRRAPARGAGGEPDGVADRGRRRRQDAAGDRGGRGLAGGGAARRADAVRGAGRQRLARRPARRHRRRAAPAAGRHRAARSPDRRARRPPGPAGSRQLRAAGRGRRRRRRPPARRAARAARPRHLAPRPRAGRRAPARAAAARPAAARRRLGGGGGEPGDRPVRRPRPGGPRRLPPERAQPGGAGRARPGARRPAAGARARRLAGAQRLAR